MGESSIFRLFSCVKVKRGQPENKTTRTLKDVGKEEKREGK